MGNDGGSIPKRIDLVREKAKEIRRDTLTINQNRSMHCAISNERFTPPVMVCRLGYLYNKETLLKCLLDKTMPKLFSHIKNLKCIKQVRVGKNEDEASPYPLLCPLSRLQFNGIEKFVVIWKCGCMISEKTLKGDECPLCAESYEPSDLIQLNASPEEIEARKKLLGVQQPSKSEFVAKKASIVHPSELENKKGTSSPLKPTMLGKKDQRDLETYLVGNTAESQGPLKQLKTSGTGSGMKFTGNPLDKLAGKVPQSETYSQLFHKGTEQMQSKSNFFKDVRFGIR